MDTKYVTGFVTLLIVMIVLIAYFTTKSSTSSTVYTIESISLPSVKLGSFTTNGDGQQSIDISSLLQYMNQYQSADGAWRADATMTVIIYSPVAFSSEFLTCAFADENNVSNEFAIFGTSALYFTQNFIVNEFNDTSYYGVSYSLNISGCATANYTGLSPPFAISKPTSLFLFWVGGVAEQTYTDFIVVVDPRPCSVKLFT